MFQICLIVNTGANQNSLEQGSSEVGNEEESATCLNIAQQRALFDSKREEELEKFAREQRMTEMELE